MRLTGNEAIPRGHDARVSGRDVVDDGCGCARGHVSQAPGAQCARTRPNRTAFRHKDLGIWQCWTWGEVHEIVRAYAAGLQSLGLKRGDKIAIVGYNRPRLYWTMAAAQWLGAIPIPVYADSVADEMAYVLAHAEVTHAAVQDQEQVDKLLSVSDQLPQLEHMLYDKEKGLRDYDHSRLHAITVRHRGRPRTSRERAGG